MSKTAECGIDSKRNVRVLNLGLWCYLILGWAMIFFAENTNQYWALPFSLNYSVFLVLELFITAMILLYAVCLRSKKLGAVEIFSSNITVYFLFFSFWFFINFILMGGYENRIFTYFVVVFPLLIHFAMMYFPKGVLLKFLKIFVISSILIIFLQMLVTVSVIDYKANQITAERIALDRAENKIIKLAASQSLKERKQDLNKLKSDLTEVKDYAFKDYYQIPLGGSNYIASILLVLSASISFLKFRYKLLKPALICLTGLTILLMESFGGLVAFFAMLFCLAVFKRDLIFNVVKNKTKIDLEDHFHRNSKKYKYSFLTAFICVLASGLIVIFNTRLSVLNVILTGRLRIYAQTINFILESPIYGNGFAVDDFIGKPHSVIFAALAYGGFVGAGFYFLLLVATGIYAYKTRTIYGKAYITMLIAVVIHGLVEPNLMNAIFDYFFWTLGAVLLALATIESTKYDFAIVDSKQFMVKIKNRAVSMLAGILGLSLILLPAIVFNPGELYTAKANVRLSGIPQSELARAKLAYRDIDEKKLNQKMLRIIAADVMENKDYLMDLRNKYFIKFDPSYPHKVLRYTASEDSNEIHITLLTPIAEPELRNKIISSLADELAKYIAKNYPIVEVKSTPEISAVKDSNPKVLLLKTAFFIMTILCWVGIVAFIPTKEKQI